MLDSVSAPALDTAVRSGVGDAGRIVMKAFFEVQTVDQVRARAAAIGCLVDEPVGLARALGRTLATDLRAPHDLPGFARATMDGYAVRGRDTFGTAEGSPGYLKVAGEVAMGSRPAFAVRPGECARIGTGGMLPEGTDAVVMVEHTRSVDGATIEVVRPAAPGANVAGAAEDARAGDLVLPRGRRLRPQDVGLLAAFGLTEPHVIRRPRVGILSTGDEVVPAEATLEPGRVRDVNAHTLAAQVLDAGGEPVPLGIVPDDRERLRRAVAESLADCDLTLLSGGSSVGTRDLTVEVFTSFEGASLLVHGVAVSPGKPFIWVAAAGRHLLGLPGQVTSCMIAFHVFVEPILERMLGREARAFTRFGRVRAHLARNLPSVHGREEYVRVRLASGDDGATADPLLGKSGLLWTMTQAQGVVRVPLHSEGLPEGTEVTVMTFPAEGPA